MYFWSNLCWVSWRHQKHLWSQMAKNDLNSCRSISGCINAYQVASMSIKVRQWASRCIKEHQGASMSMCSMSMCSYVRQLAYSCITEHQGTSMSIKVHQWASRFVLSYLNWHCLEAVAHFSITWQLKKCIKMKQLASSYSNENQSCTNEHQGLC